MHTYKDRLFCASGVVLVILEDRCEWVMDDIMEEVTQNGTDFSRSTVQSALNRLICEGRVLRICGKTRNCTTYILTDNGIEAARSMLKYVHQFYSWLENSGYDF